MCTDQKKTTSLTFPGTDRIKKCVLGDHDKGKKHKEAVEEARMRNVTAKAMLKETTREDSGLANTFRLVLWLAKEDIALLKIDSLCATLGRCGASVLGNYRNNHSAAEMASCLAEILRSELVDQVTASPFFSILIDESNDIAIHKQLISYVSYIGPAGPTVDFLGLYKLQDISADAVYATLRRQLSAYGLDASFIVGFGSDGASVMTGKHNGVGAKLKNDVGHVFAIHCVAHRLALATSSAAEKVDYISGYAGTLQSLHNYVNHSSLRKEELHVWQETYDEPVLTLKRPCATRWLSLSNSVATLGRSYTSILAFLQLQTKSQAINLLSTLETWRYAATTHFMWDIIGDLAQLSKAFQSSTLPVHQQLQLVASTIRSIRATYLSDTGPQFGPHYRKWNESLGDDLTVNGQQLIQAEEDVLHFNADVKAFAEAVITALEERFPEDQLMYSASVIDPSLIPSADDDIVTYGNDGITYLADFLSEIVDQEQLEEEWMRFKFIKFPATSLQLANRSLWDFYFQYRETFPHLWKLVQILLVLPLNTAACERGFSLMNIVKTNRRNRLSDELLDQLMVVSLLAAKKTEQEETKVVSEAVKLWYSKKKRYFV